MARRSTKLLRFENNLYRYDKENQEWKTSPLSFSNSEDSVDLFEKGSLSTCKHMSQKINPNLLRKGFLHSWEFSSSVWLFSLIFLPSHSLDPLMCSSQYLSVPNVGVVSFCV